MNDAGTPHTFILGCERSGSTWLSNVLDAHPDVEFLMEPFADYAGLFPGFPSRNLYTDFSHALAKSVRDGYANLADIKYLLLYNRKRSLQWKKADRLIVNLFTRIGQWQKLTTPERVKQYELLNLNSAKVPIKWQVKKNEVPTMTVTKELRLNFKIGLLGQVFPQSRYIIVVRHPGAQVASIMRLFEMGNLGELKRSLVSLYAHVRTSRRFEKYSDYYECLDNGSDIREQLLLWWLINYETLIDDCKHYKLDYEIVYNEDLSEKPLEGYQRIMSFLGLTYSRDVKSYINHSSMGPARNARAGALSPVDTVRDSYSHSKLSISNIDQEMKRSINALYTRFSVIDELSHYQRI